MARAIARRRNVKQKDIETAAFKAADELTGRVRAAAVKIAEGDQVPVLILKALELLEAQPVEEWDASAAVDAAQAMLSTA